MSESKFETVSSLVDNFHHEDAVLDDVLKDNDMSDTWQRYHLIGDVLRDDVPTSIDIDLSDAITNAIAEEPTVLAPATKSSLSRTVKAKVVTLLKPFGQVAIAASAAGLMVLGVQTNVADNDTVTPYQVVQTGYAVGGVAEPVSLNFQQNTRVDKQQAIVEQQRRFQALLQDHKQQMKFSAAIVTPQDNVSKQEAEKPVK
ncbi:sigma-E factor negative regulatory protein [Thalassotalea sediminis]|uniref:sigma-E factor negative regulatory protein n=1 Tax=Thalassotalea sediminis TaxID=1759089 RepID=UPI0025745586|nr:RseA family anti-sigma factor [Thalassotalea sediminis]